jgi:ATP-dependent exoDNAse (exonuclease V) alpha subunit
MEVLSLAGYTENEKLEIARRYLVRRQLHANGLTAEQAEVRPRGAAAAYQGVYSNKHGIGKKAPSTYIAKFAQSNTALAETLKTHLIKDINEFGVTPGNRAGKLILSPAAVDVARSAFYETILCSCGTNRGQDF